MRFSASPENLLQNQLRTLLPVHQHNPPRHARHCVDKTDQPRLISMPRKPTHRDHLRPDFVHLPIQINLHKPFCPFTRLDYRPGVPLAWYPTNITSCRGSPSMALR